MNTREYARLVGVSQRTIQRWIKNGQLDAERTGNRYSISESEPSPSAAPPPTKNDPVETLQDRGYLTTVELAGELGVTPGTVRRRIRAGEIQAVKIRGKYQIPLSEQDEDGGHYIPEPIEPDEDDDFPVTDESTIPVKDLRKTHVTLEGVIIYASPIPVPYRIIKNQEGLFRVVIEYDTVIIEDSGEVEE